MGVSPRPLGPHLDPFVFISTDTAQSFKNIHGQGGTSSDGSNCLVGTDGVNVGHIFQCNRKGRLIFSGNDEESGSEMFFTEIETSEIEADALLLWKKKAQGNKTGKHLAATATLRNLSY